ncbi:DUF6907 domain-containing protein [Streptomyces mirabilis]|uniref:DUF6907 domain-containing protein n=1 Tax=Streptomyces mirabilis TaxID=68239 RepID=UPI0036960B1A
MSAEPRTVTITTIDRGDVAIPCPAWCAGHAHHDPETEYADIIHSGPESTLTFGYTTLLTAGLVQSPHATDATPGLGGRTPGVSVHPLGKTLGPVGLYELAAALDTYADHIRDLADQLDTLLAGGDQ